MKKTVLFFLLAMVILMSAVACTPDEPAPDTTTAGITTEDPDATTTAEPEDNPADGSTTTAEPEDDPADGSTTTAEPEDDPADGSTTTAEPEDDPADGSTTTAEPDGVTTTKAPDEGATTAPDPEEEPAMWNEKKDIVTALSFDQLWEGMGTAGVDVFTPGQSSKWNGVVDLTYSTTTGVTFWGWAAVKGELGGFGYYIHGQEPVFDAAWSVEDTGLTQHYLASGGDTGSRMRVAIDLTGLTGTQTVDVYYKNPAGEVVTLYRFTVITSTLTEVPLPTVTPTAHATLPEGYGVTAADVVYKGDDDAILYTFENKTKADFDAVCAYYTGEGYTVYRATEKAGNHFATLTKGTAMAHVYLFGALSELNIVLSDTAAHNLPPVSPAVTDGDIPCTVVQLKDDTHVNGMSYVIQLKDGSYIVYDGSYETQAELLLDYLRDNHVGEGKPLVRAWVLTHSHGDHYPASYKIARRWAEELTVEYILLNPLSDEEFELNDEERYLSTYFPYDAARFAGAKTVYVHTGMEFVFCNLTMEVLWSPADLYKDVTVKTIANRPLNFNNTSVVTRLYDAEYSALFTGDIGKAGTTLMESIYGSYLRSDICQVSHHGVEDVPLSFYETVQAPMLFYPCSVSLYDLEGRNSDVRIALERKAYTKEILIAGIDSFERAWGHTYDANATVSIPGYVRVPKNVDYRENTDLLVSDKTLYKEGEAIMVTAVGDGTDWIGIAKLGEGTPNRFWGFGSGDTAVASGTPFNLLTAAANGASGNLPAGEYLLFIVPDGKSFNDLDYAATYRITVVGADVDLDRPTYLVTPEEIGDMVEGEEYTRWSQTTVEQKNGYITLTSTGIDPRIVPLVGGQTVGGESPLTTQLFVIKYRTSVPANLQVFVNAASQSLVRDLTADGEWHLLALDLSQVNAAGKPITWLRVDYTRTPNATMDIQYMGFFYSTEGVESYDAQFDGTDFASQPTVEPEKPNYDGMDRLTVNKTEFTLGEPIMITAYGSGTDWVGIFTEKNATGGSKQWWRLQDVDGYVHTPSGEPFDATSTKGNTVFAFTTGTWYISLVDVDESGNRTLVECIEITVTESAAE